MSNDIKINVKADADLGGISAAMDKLNQKAVDLQDTLGKATTIGVDNTQALSKIKEVGQADEEAKRRVSGVPASSTSERPEELSIKRQQQQLKALTEEVRKHTNLKRELNEVDLKAYSNATKRMAHSGSAFGAYAAAAGDDPKKLAELSPAASKHALTSTGFVDPSNKTKTGAAVASPYGGKLASAAIGMAGGMVAGGAGGDGLALAGSALGGMAGSVFGPVGSMIGGALGGMAGSVVGGGMGDAKEEAVGITDLRHSLGATTTDFNLLRESTRAAASGMGQTSIEATRLSKQFSHNANTQGKDAGSLAAEVRLASGFSRSLGIDPSQGVEAMSTLRNTRATTDEAGSRKMAMTIAEAISKNGMGSKGDEVLSAIANFAQTNARASLVAPNAEGYTDFLGRMVGMKTPGLDVQGSASLLGKADAGVRSHGDMAAETLKLSALSVALPGMDATKMRLFTSGGAMGTSRPVLEDLAKDKGHRGNWARETLKKDSGNLDRPMQDLLMIQLKKMYKDGSMRELAGARMFGMEQNEFRKFSTGWEQGGGTSSGMREKLIKAGITNVDSLDPAKYMHMGSLLGSNKDELKAEAQKLIGGKVYDKELDAKQKEHLSGTMENGTEEQLRAEVIKLNEDRSMRDEGSDAREGTAAMKQIAIDLSSRLLPAVNSVRDAILMTTSGGHEKLLKYQQDERLQKKFTKIDADAEIADKRGDFITADVVGGLSGTGKNLWARQQKEAARAQDDKETKELDEQSNLVKRYTEPVAKKGANTPPGKKTASTADDLLPNNEKANAGKRLAADILENVPASAKPANQGGHSTSTAEVHVILKYPDGKPATPDGKPLKLNIKSAQFAGSKPNSTTIGVRG